MAAAPDPSDGNSGTISFVGFSEEEKEIGRTNIRLWKLEEDNAKLKETVSELVDVIKGLKSDKELAQELRRELKESKEKLYGEIKKLREENELLKNELNQSAMGRGDNVTTSEISDVVEKIQSWKKESEKQKIDMKEIIRQQQQEHLENMEKQVVRVIKQKDKVVRDTVQKKMSVVVFGAKEKNLPMKTTREKEEMKMAKDIITKVAEDDGIVQQIEEVYRLGKYDSNKTRPMKIRFTTQTAAECVLERTSKLAKVDDMKDIWIRRDMNEDERKKIKELVAEAKAKNEERTPDEVNKFFWKVIDMRIRKWWLKSLTVTQ